DALANQVISDDSDLVKDLGKSAYQSFMKPIQNMQPIIPKIIQEKCNSFVEKFTIERSDELLPKISHNKIWKESEEVLVKITGEILNTLPAFTPKFENTQSKGTYVTDIIVPLLRATLKKLPIRKIALFIT
ncbi:13882_t:CDS:2, partial [Funneliformis geosporum]